MSKTMQVFEIFKKYSEVAEMNFKAKGSMVEWKLVAKKRFGKFSYVEVPSSPSSISVSFTYASN